MYDNIPIYNKEQYIYKAKYALHHFQTYTNVYIGIGCTSMYKVHLNNMAFNKVHIA